MMSYFKNISLQFNINFFKNFYFLYLNKYNFFYITNYNKFLYKFFFTKYFFKKFFKKMFLINFIINIKKKKKILKIILFLIESKIKKRGLRFQQLFFRKLNKNQNFGFNLLFNNKKKINFYQHRFLNKKFIVPKINFTTHISSYTFIFTNLIVSFKKFYSILKNVLGEYLVTPLTECVFFGELLFYYKNAIKLIFFLYPGSLFKLKLGFRQFIISNIGLIKPKYITTFGSYTLIFNFKRYLVKFLLLTGKEKWISSNCYGFLGRVWGKWHLHEYLGKASKFQNYRSINVRGIAKNPVDHPNGGRAKGKNPFLTPWGKIAKANR